MRFSWIAVALATAIRLYAPVELRTVIVTAALAIGGAIVARTNARTNARTKPQRIAAVFLLLVALVDGTSLWRAYRTLCADIANFQITRISKPADIYPVFRKLFAKHLPVEMRSRGG